MSNSVCWYHSATRRRHHLSVFTRRIYCRCGFLDERTKFSTHVSKSSAFCIGIYKTQSQIDVKLEYKFKSCVAPDTVYANEIFRGKYITFITSRHDNCTHLFWNVIFRININTNCHIFTIQADPDSTTTKFEFHPVSEKRYTLFTMQKVSEFSGETSPNGKFRMKR